MLIPTKHEKLNKNSIVVGSDVIKVLKNKSYDIESLFTEIKKDGSISLGLFYNTLLFLWLANIINVDQYQVSLKKIG